MYDQWPVNRRFSRRRALAGAGAAALGLASAALIGCSSNAKAPEPKSPAPAAGQPSAAPAAEAPKYGGAIRYPMNKDSDGIDPNISAGGIPQTPASNVYSRLFVFEPGQGKAASGKIIGDLA